MLKKFPAFYGTRRFITWCTRARVVLIMSQINPVDALPKDLFLSSLLIHSYHVLLGLPCCFFRSGLPAKAPFEPYVYWTVHHLTSWINWTNLMSLYETFYCSTCFECYCIHPQEPATVYRCIVLFRCVLVYWCGSAGVGWYPSAGWSTNGLLFVVCSTNQ